MKKVSPLLLLIFSFSLFAQDDDYCPCQDEMAQEAEIFEYFTSINSQIAVFVSEENNFDPIPEVFKEPDPIPIEFPPKQTKEESLEEQDLSIEPDQLKEKMVAGMDARKSKMKKFKKRKRAKLKRKKKARKYKGKCPFF